MEQRVLLVEDEKEIRETTREILEREGYTVKAEITTSEAWECIQEWTPDLILVDIMLPGEIKDFVKRVDQIGGVKILYLSAFAKQNAKKRGLLDLSKQIIGYISKPFSIETLLEKVKNAFEQ